MNFSAETYCRLEQSAFSPDSPQYSSRFSGIQLRFHPSSPRTPPQKQIPSRLMRISCYRKSDRKNPDLGVIPGKYEWVVIDETDNEFICSFYSGSGNCPVINTSEESISCISGRRTSLKKGLFGEEVHFFKGRELLFSVLRRNFKAIFSNDFKFYVPRMGKDVVAKKLKGFSPWSYHFLGVTIYFPMRGDVEFYFDILDILDTDLGHLDEILCFSIWVLGVHYS